MALAVQIAVTGGATYNLEVQKVAIRLARNPIQAPLPGGSDPLLLDLGQFRPSVTMEGDISNVQAFDDGGVTIPTKRQLEDMVTDDYASVITISVTSESITDSYVGKVSNLTFTLISAVENRWSFILGMATVGRS